MYIYIRTFLDADCVAGAITPEFLRSHFSKSSPMGHLSLENEWESRHSPGGSDATFVLEYCMRDMPPVAYSALNGLEIVPMEAEGVLGKLGDPTDMPLFMASEFERKFLQRVGKVSSK